MSKKAIVVVGMLLFGAAYAFADKAEALYKTYHLNSHTVVVTCKDGQVPVVQPYNSKDAVFVTCPDGK